MKRLSLFFGALAVLLSDVMFFVVAYNYRGTLCAIEHAGFSAPASIALIYAVPFLIFIIICVVLSIRFYKKSK